MTEEKQLDYGSSLSLQQQYIVKHVEGFTRKTNGDGIFCQNCWPPQTSEPSKPDSVYFGCEFVVLCLQMESSSRFQVRPTPIVQA